MKKPKEARRELSHEIIVDAALTLINRSGIERFSIRELAKYLRVYPTAIYWYLDGGGVQSLLASVLGHALRNVVPEVSDTVQWQDWLRTLFHRYREAVRRHPNVATLIGSHLVTDAGVKPVMAERLLMVLTRSGLSGTRLTDIYNAIVAAMVGYVTLELALEPMQSEKGWATKFKRQLRELDAREYPMVAQHLEQMSNRAFMLRWQNGVKAPLSGGFNAFVEAFLIGLQVMIAAPRADDQAGARVISQAADAP